MKFKSDSFIDFIDDSIVNSIGYNDADHNLSFSLRDENDRVVSYITLKSENYNHIKGQRGCRITNLYVERLISSEKFSVINTSLLDRLYQEAHMRIVVWGNDGLPAFDYMWFKIGDFDESVDFMDYLQSDCCMYDNIVVIPINRK